MRLHDRRRSTRSRARKAARGLPSFDACVRGAARGARDDVEELVDTLLYEGYALYPYTPGATKNATPTPFGIVYPPAYAAGSAATFDHAADGVPRARRRRRVLAARCASSRRSGERHQAAERAPASTLAELRRGAHGPFAFGARRARASGRDARRRPLARDDLRGQPRRGRPRAWTAPSALRALAALDARRSLRVAGGASSRRWRRRRASSVNTCPVLATPTDDARARRRDRAARPPADRAREPRRACSTRPRSRRRCCCTCSRSRDDGARGRSPRRTRRCARCSSAPTPRRPRRSCACTAA